MKKLAVQLRRTLNESQALVDSLRAARASLESNSSIIRRAILLMRIDGFRSRVLRLDRLTLNGLCHRLLDPKLTNAQARRWLNRQLGITLPRSTFYRFACCFADMVRAIAGEGST